MNAKTMEGLIGAGVNMNLVDTPMRVYREARRKGDLGTMERSMGYAGEFAGRADEYRMKAGEGMKEEAEELREKEKAEQEQRIEERREEREKLEERMKEVGETDTDTVEVSEEGKRMLQENRKAESVKLPKPEMGLSGETVTDTGTETSRVPVTYTKTGEIDHTVSQTSDYSKIV